MKHITYNGPVCTTYTPFKDYPIVYETNNYWLIYDDEAFPTYVSKKENVYWTEITLGGNE